MPCARYREELYDHYARQLAGKSTSGDGGKLYVWVRIGSIILLPKSARFNRGWQRCWDIADSIAARGAFFFLLYFQGSFDQNSEGFKSPSTRRVHFNNNKCNTVIKVEYLRMSI